MQVPLLLSIAKVNLVDAWRLLAKPTADIASEMRVTLLSHLTDDGRSTRASAQATQEKTG